MINTEAILDFFAECIFDEDLTDDNFFDNVIEHLPKDVSFSFFSGATKLVIIFPGADYVVKIPFNGQYTYNADDDELIFWEFENGSFGRTWDYCLGEVEQYERAKEEGLENFFAKTEFIGYVSGHPIYIQERAEIFDEHDEYLNCSKERRKSASDTCDAYGYSCFNVWWIADLQDYCEECMFHNLMDYITTNINDLHRGNIGYINGKPVLVDYSGFDD